MVTWYVFILLLLKLGCHLLQMDIRLGKIGIFFDQINGIALIYSCGVVIYI